VIARGVRMTLKIAQSHGHSLPCPAETYGVDAASLTVSVTP